MLGNSWKLCAGKFGWMPVAFLMGVIMAQCYSIILQFQGNGTWSSVEHPSSTDLSRTMQSEASERSYRKCRAGDGERNPAGANGHGFWQASTAASKQRVRL